MSNESVDQATQYDVEKTLNEIYVVTATPDWPKYLDLWSVLLLQADFLSLDFDRVFTIIHETRTNIRERALKQEAIQRSDVLEFALLLLKYHKKKPERSNFQSPLKPKRLI